MTKELPKAYEASQYEDDIYKKWEEGGYFNPDNLNLSENTKTYSIILPPPNVTGTLHAGHAAMLAYEDILIRFHRMRGDRALWVPGTDHAAIATQTKVEKIIKEEGTNRHEMGREKFLERVRQFAQDSHDTIIGQCKKMGASLDWSREAYTLDETRTKAVRNVFKMMYDDGLIYRGERIVNWCPRCHSTLADDEVEHKEQKSGLYTFRYDKNFPIAIATTRPETKLGDVAVAVNPKDDRYKDYVGKEYEVDFCGVPLKIKIIADREVDMEFGTGAIGVTPAHSVIDWVLAEKNNLSITKVIDEDGKIKEGFGNFSGKSVKEVREMIISELKNRFLIEKEEEIENKLSICYRCDTAIEPLPSLQWFVDVNKPLRGRKQETGNRKQVIDWEGKTIKDVAIEVVKDKKIRIIPDRFEKNYFHWMENLRDWCISRQIWFGHQVPVWYCKKSKIKNQKSKCSNSFVSTEDLKECPYCGGKIEQDPDTLDTWFSSGLWTFSTLADSPAQVRIEDGRLVIDSDDFKNFHPTSVLETGYDILFFWVARMIIMTTYAVEDIPFQDVYLHGLVLDNKGKKMSKSKGNVINPLDMIAEYGADATRLSLVIGSTPGNDLKLNEEKIAGYRNMVNKLWNISRYILSDYELKITNHELNQNNLTLADEWILVKIQSLSKQVTDDLENYRFSQAGEKLRDFTWNDLADWYLEASKFQQSSDTPNVLSHVLAVLLKLWHPFIPFVTEVIWQEAGMKKPLIINQWPQGAITEHFRSSFEDIRNLIVSIRNARSENKVEPSQKIEAVIYAGAKKDLFESQKELIKKLRTGIEKLEIKERGEKIEGAIFVSVSDIEIYLIGAIDIEKEKLRIKKEAEKLEKIILDMESKLSNQGFVEKAPKNIVAQENAKLESSRQELKKLTERFNSLK